MSAVGAPRRDLEHIRITRRDLEVLYWLADQYGVRKDQLPRLLGGLGDRTIRALIDRWVRGGLVSRRKVFAHEPAWVWPTRAGLGLLDRPVAYWEPRAGILDHVFWVNEVRMLVRERHPHAKWISERRMRSERGGRNFSKHMPDAVVIRDGSQLAIEVELSQKSAERASAMVRSLASHFDGVWIFCRRGAPKDAIQRILSRADMETSRRVRVLDLEESNGKSSLR